MKWASRDRRPRWSRTWMHRALLGGSVAIVGCDRAASTLDPRGPRAAEVADLWWIMLGMGGAISAVVVIMVVFAVLRQRAETGTPPRLLSATGEDSARGQRMILYGGVILPVVVLTATTVFTIRTMNATAAPPAPTRFTIEIIGHMWWWEVRYPAYGIVTANEVHVPVGQPVELKLSSPDVIHSFWVPQVQGKLDLVPGRVNTTWLQVDVPGVYRGPCAEFCGLQHAHMELLLVADAPDVFEDWVQLQQQPASPPADVLVARGAQIFAREGCISCHAVRYGEAAPPRIGGIVAPDLTHVASRRRIAAGMLPTTKGNMAGWIANPQAIKPGNGMPVLYVDSADLEALVAYMMSLE